MSIKNTIYKASLIIFSLLLMANYANAAEYSDNFNNGLGRWSIVDLATKNGPSNWTTSNGELYQRSNIGNGNKYYVKDNRLGSALLFNNFSTRTFSLSVDFNSIDNDGVGLIFGYQNSNNFYQFLITNEEKQAMLVRFNNGNSQIIARTNNTYNTRQWHNLKAKSQNGRIYVYLNDVLIINTSFNQSGKVGLAVWANENVYFDNFVINNTGSSINNSTTTTTNTYYNNTNNNTTPINARRTRRTNSNTTSRTNTNYSSQIITPRTNINYSSPTNYEYNIPTVTRIPVTNIQVKGVKYINWPDQVSLVKTSNNSMVYLIAKNKKHKILNPSTFFDYGFNWGQVQTITDYELQQYPFAKVVKTPNSPNVYYIHNGLNKKKLIPTPTIFLAYGNKWEDIITISQKDLASYSKIWVIRSDTNSTIYELRNGVKKAIPDTTTFISAGYKWNEILTIKDIELDYYPTKMIVNNQEIIVAGAKYNGRYNGRRRR